VACSRHFGRSAARPAVLRSDNLSAATHEPGKLADARSPSVFKPCSTTTAWSRHASIP
jgi:hypothetical protein